MNIHLSVLFLLLLVAALLWEVGRILDRLEKLEKAQKQPARMIAGSAFGLAPPKSDRPNQAT